jgi:hypothetical protein
VTLQTLQTRVTEFHYGGRESTCGIAEMSFHTRCGLDIIIAGRRTMHSGAESCRTRKGWHWSSQTVLGNSGRKIAGHVI